MVAAFRAGVAWRDFWGLTPYATRLIIEAHSENLRAAYETQVTGAFHAAYFSRMERLSSRDLEKALKRKPAATRQQTDEEIGRNVFAWLKSAENVNGSGPRP